MQFVRFQILTLFLIVCFSSLYAQKNSKLKGNTDSLRVFQIPQIDIISQRDGIFGRLPGSADYLNEVQLQRLAPLTGNEILRKVTGIHVVDEEGAGLRMNLGIRGLDPDRSRGVLILEDGIPVALNPYGEPEMYYTPSIDRMAGIEIVKGSGQILFGPQTIGGVINYITQDPPEKSQTKLRVIGG